jgi:hypothetical protein
MTSREFYRALNRLVKKAGVFLEISQVAPFDARFDPTHLGRPTAFSSKPFTEQMFCEELKANKEFRSKLKAQHRD